MRGPPTDSSSVFPAARGRTRSASSTVTFERSMKRITGWVRTQSSTMGWSIVPSDSIGTSPGVELTSTKRPGPIRAGDVPSSTTTSKVPMPPVYSGGVFVSRTTCGSVFSAFSRNRFPGLTRRTRSFLGSGITAWTTLSASRSSRTSATALTVAPF